jgi:hypothetical protein
MTVVLSAEPQSPAFGDRVHVRAAGGHVVPAVGRWEVVEQRTTPDGWSATLVCLQLDCGKPAVLVGSRRRAFPVAVRTRAGVVDESRLRAQTTPPPWRYRLDGLWVGLAALAAALVAAGIRLARPQRVDASTPLERALAAVREARRRPAPERRVAVGALADELRRLGRSEADRSDRLAWSAPDPDPRELDALVEAVESR